MDLHTSDHLRSYAKGKKSGAPSWMLVRITGLLLVILTVGHYVMMHYNPASGHDYDWTSARLSSPLFKGMYLSFITIGMYHGLIGVCIIVREFKSIKSPIYTISSALIRACV